METTLYDLKGQAVAYLAHDGDSTIYLWSGPAVAYVKEQRIYAWKGKHLGWFIDGIVYDCIGHWVGVSEDRNSATTLATEAKAPKLAKTTKLTPYPPAPKPVLTLTHADIPLSRFLRQ